MTAARTLRIGRREVGLSNPNKVLYPDAGFTKAGVVDYYVRIAPVLLPHLKSRAVTLKRYPNGADGMFFYEKNCPTHRPEWVPTVTVASRRREGGVHYCLINDAASLAWVANLASLELHTSLARSKDVTRPTMMVFDFDPGPPAGMLQCIKVAARMRDLLERLGLQSFPKTSGGKGLHLYVPLNTPRVNFDRTKAFAHALAMLLEREDPGLITSVMAKAERPGKVFIDWSQNDQHKTTVSVYSLRARERPTVSTPVTWDELETAVRKGDASSLVFEAARVLRRVQQRGDLFASVQTLKQRLPDL